MPSSDLPDNEPTTALRDLAAQAHGLRMLVLYGSRARTDARPDSDWDLGYLADGSFDPGALYVDLSRTLNTDAIDLADLERANGLLRYNVASDGRVLFEASPGEWERFWMAAVTFWCDVEPVLRPAYDAVLARYQR